VVIKRNDNKFTFWWYSSSFFTCISLWRGSTRSIFVYCVDFIIAFMMKKRKEGKRGQSPFSLFLLFHYNFIIFYICIFTFLFCFYFFSFYFSYYIRDSYLWTIYFLCCYYCFFVSFCSGMCKSSQVS